MGGADCSVDRRPLVAERGASPAVEVLPERISLEIVRVIDTPQSTHIRYRVHR